MSDLASRDSAAARSPPRGSLVSLSIFIEQRYRQRRSCQAERRVLCPDRPPLEPDSLRRRAGVNRRWYVHFGSKHANPHPWRPCRPASPAYRNRNCREAEIAGSHHAPRSGADFRRWPQAARSSLEGRSNAAPSPISPNRMREAIAQAYDRYPGATTDTMIVPAIAVPNDEPRLETLRESPEISPCSASGKLD